MSDAGAQYPQWKAPSEEGRLLVWPAGRDLLEQARDNHAHLSAEQSVRVGGLPLAELRRACRRWLGHSEDAQSLVMTGHQTELYHPGVWVKNAVIGAAATALWGRAYHLAVDTDAPKHLHLRWPGGAIPITDDPEVAGSAWSGRLPAPTPGHIEQIEQSLRAAAGAWDFEPVVFDVLDSLRRTRLETEQLAPALVNATHALDWDLGLRHHALLASPLWQSPGFLVFVHHVCGVADAFAEDYNAALAAYRREKRVRRPGRPMPDLQLAPDRCEGPFWLDDLETGRRRRLTLSRSTGAWTLQAAGEQFTFDAAGDGWARAEALGRWLVRRRLRVSPRALTLTMFCRLLLADIFVHGIGGGNYDQVTDRLIAGHLGIRPPAFAVTTATLYFPGATERPRVCLPCIRHEEHTLRHALLGERKLRYLRRIEAEPRRSPQRREVYHQMHEELTREQARSDEWGRWGQKRAEAGRRFREEQELFDREMFYALQPRQRLAELIDRCREQVTQ